MADRGLYCKLCGEEVRCSRGRLRAAEREWTGRVSLIGAELVSLGEYLPTFLSKHCDWSSPQLVSFQLPLEAEAAWVVLLSYPYTPNRENRLAQTFPSTPIA